ncbi:glycosyltransferase family 2 protein [Serratia rubidaea]|uniref:glycosyltransferase family 2 protein n=1 Tax=Serratia rubidaea TaxID=61652 RepID=UPI003FA3A201
MKQQNNKSLKIENHYSSMLDVKSADNTRARKHMLTHTESYNLTNTNKSLKNIRKERNKKEHGDYGMGITISAAIIIKNEERCIARCIDSLLPLFDEVVILDTGSTDNTIRIIRDYKDEKIKIFFSNWEDNFAKARNEAMKKCNCKYIFFIDADEYISSNIKEFTCELKRIDEINNTRNNDAYAYSPIIKDHENNITKNIRRVFINCSEFYYFGYIHEELRRKGNKKIIDKEIKITIQHDGYKKEIIKSKDKQKRNENLNLKNLDAEPKNLRWIFFHFRDSFENLPPKKIYQSLYSEIVIDKKNKISTKNIRNDLYTFGILDLMARAKLKSMCGDSDFHNIINIMSELIPFNSNSFYYELIYDIFKWKIKAKKRINDIFSFKKNRKQYHDGMINSEGLHIDAALSFYLYEVGLLTQAKELLESVQRSGFSSELTHLYSLNAKHQE